MINELKQAMRSLATRLSTVALRGVVTGSDDANGIQSVSVKSLPQQSPLTMERFQSYGFTSAPKDGAEAITLSLGGDRARSVCLLVDDRRYRVTTLKPGEVAIYDDQDQSVKLTADGIEIDGKALKMTAPTLEMNAPTTTINATTFVVNASQKCVVAAPFVHLGGEGGQPVSRVGDSIGNYQITSGSPKVTAL